MPESSASHGFDLLDDPSHSVKYFLTMSEDLDRVAVFIAVAEANGFRAAGDRLRISGSAVSQTVRLLEEQLGVPLLHRTTRSVSLTEAGQRLYADARPALEDLRAAVASASELGAEPGGTLRIHVAGIAQAFLSEAAIADFLAKHPRVRLDLLVSDDPVDIVAAGYDAGVRLGEVIDRDMIAVPITGDLRLQVVGSPGYFATHRKPKHPRDLADHACINFHATETAPPYRWEFTEDGRDFAIDVRAQVMTNDAALNVRLAIAGAGLTMGDDHRLRDPIARRELVPVLEEFSTPFPGFYLYYPQRRNTSPALRAFVEQLRRARRTRGRRKS